MPREQAPDRTTSHLESPPLAFSRSFSTAGVKSPVNTSQPAPFSAMVNQETDMTVRSYPVPPSSTPEA